MPEIVKNDQNRDSAPRFQGNQNTHNQTFDVYHKYLIRSSYNKDFMTRYQKLAEIFQKNLRKSTQCTDKLYYMIGVVD